MNTRLASVAAAALLMTLPRLATAAPPASCALGTNSGIDAADAKTAEQLVCREVSRHAAPGAVVRVDLGKLGSKVIVAVSVKNEAGQLTESQAALGSIDEVTVAAPRLAVAAVKGEPYQKTEKVDNVTAEEARSVKRKSGDLRVAFGVTGLIAPYADKVPFGPGLNLGLNYDTPRWSIVSDMRFGISDDGSPGTYSYFSIGAGARYFLTKGDHAPFIGAGLAADMFKRHKDTVWGAATYGEVGVEFLRTQKTSLTTSVRADAPFFKVEDKYFVPVTFNVGIKLF